MYRRCLLISLVLAIASGCERREEPHDGVHRLTGRVLATGDYLDQPGHMTIAGGRLLVLDRTAPMIHVFGLSDGKRLGSFGQKGDGPGEFRSTRDVQVDVRDPRDVWIYDMSLLRMTRVRVGQGPLPEFQEMVKLHNGGGVYLHPAWLTDTTLAVSAIAPMHPQGRLLLTRRTGEVIRTIGQTPRHPDAASIPTTVLQHAYESYVTVRPDRARFATATRQADRLEIYRADGTQLAQVAGSTGFLPVFEVNQRAEGVSMALGGEVRAGYMDLESNDDRIYALFSGVRLGDDPQQAFFGREVHVFDWDGNLLARLKLDAPALTIAVAPDEKQLFAIRHDPEPSVVRYDLPQPLPGG